MRYAFLIIGIATLLFSDTALYSLQTGADDSRTVVCAARPAPRASANKAVNPKEASDPPLCRIETRDVSNGLCSSRLSVSAKALYFERHSFAPGAFASPLFTAGPELAKPPVHYPKQWRDDVGAFGRLYGDALAFQTAAQTGRFLTGIAVHEDPRYSTSTNRNALARAIHAIAFTAVDKSDSGRATFAISNFAGAASAGIVGTTYLPAGYNDSSHALGRMGMALASFAASNLASEFSPELRRVGKRLHLPQLILGTTGEKPVSSRRRTEILAGGN